MKILFMADFSITASDILENKKVFDSYEDVEVDVIEVNLGETKEERASYILRTEQEGPEWTSVPEEVLEKALETIAKIDIVTGNGIIVCESPAESVLPEGTAPYEKGREYRYGKIMLTTYLAQEAQG